MIPSLTYIIIEFNRLCINRIPLDLITHTEWQMGGQHESIKEIDVIAG
ncbi:hypothetical protein DESC_190129 [Desulfosarcina cetonica]|nr:hypothetical protein DESC_190129 [Desulfosarcina cetonica]